ncbi:hypothetical protein FJZ55_03625, partial [Candidatus Woesearchaeota archaeon]|nr:hypothetical protein [Candidatus Woesearchaeota archaeon]
QAYNQPVEVDYRTADGTAKAGTDYQPVFDTLVFNPGVVTGEIRIPIVGDTDTEADDTFTVMLGSARNATINPAASQSSVTIRNDDAPAVFIKGNRQTPIVTNEGDTVRVDVVLSQPLKTAVSVNYLTQPFNDPTTATAGLDYDAINGTLTFQPGEILKTLQIPVRDDSLVEGLERFSLQLNTPRGARLPSPDEEFSLNGSVSREIQIQDNDFGIPGPIPTPNTGSLRYHLFNGKWYNNINHTQTVPVSTVTAALKNGPTTVQVDGLDAPTVIQISGWTPDDKLVFNTRNDDAQRLLGTAQSFADVDLGVLVYGRRYTTTKTNTFGSTSQIQRVTGVLWETTSKGTAHWIVYGTANPSTASFPVLPEWVDGLDKTLAKINPAGGVYGDYLKAGDIVFI